MTFTHRFCLLAILTVSPAFAEENLLIADFDGADFGKWTASGDAFGKGPAKGSLDGQMGVDGFRGAGFASSYHGGDDSTGKLISAPFKIERKFINFLIGGGGFQGETCINLVSEGKVIKTSSGRNTAPGGSEHLNWENWDVSGLMGKIVTIEIVDERKGGWGHISVDQIVQSDKTMIMEARHEFTINKRYLVWPVTRDTSKRHKFHLTLDSEQLPFSFSNIGLTDKPDFWTFTDLADFQGKTLTVTGSIPRELEAAWDLVKLSDTFPGEDVLYQEPERPQFHFTSRRGWLNDPNGLVYQDGTWHLFYQHNPYNHGWDNMHWGHATSTDLLHWDEMPDALYPQAEGFMYSGSGFVIPKNRTSLQVTGDTALGLAYTAAGSHSYVPGKKFTQALAISNDGGKTFQKFDGNPVVPHYVDENRDPKVFWHEPTSKWVMTIYDTRNEYGIYTSPDLVEWTRTSTFEIPHDAECPDLFELAIDGDPARTHWVVWGANGKYRLGDFDGKEFKPHTGSLQHYFGNAYAGQSYDNAPDGRRVHIGWMRGGGPMNNSPFNLQMTLPLDFELRDINGTVRLWIQPSPEVVTLRDKTKEWRNLIVGATSPDPLAYFKESQFEVQAVIDADSSSSEMGFKVFGEDLAIWKKADQTFSGMNGAQVPIEGKINLQIFVDTCSVEAFVNGSYIGRYLTQRNDVAPISVVTSGGDVHFDSLKIHSLKSVWK